MNRLCAAVAVLSLMTMACKKSTPGTGGTTTSASLEVVFQDSTYQLSGVAISKEGRLFVSYPLWSTTYQNALVEIVNGAKNPYPSQAWNSWVQGNSGTNQFVDVQSITIDANDNLWVVDAASPDELGIFQ